MIENGNRPDLFLIDGNSLVYRAFFALPEAIATSAGEPTNAIFGFASMLVKLITEYGVAPTAVVWDAGVSGRTEIYPEYKAQRSARPDLLKQQWPAFAPLVDAFGYTNLSVEGFEADDVIASVAEKAKAEGVTVMIVTGDRDAFQLVDERVHVMATARGITETKIYDRTAVLDRYGIPPELIPDFYGLKGDTSDNIPGVPGIGEKTAAQLLQQFGDLDGILSSIDEIAGPKRKENLREHSENARISKQLATAQREIPVEFDIHHAIKHEPDRSELRDMFRRYELRDPLRRLEEALLEDSGESVPQAPLPVRKIAARKGSAADAAKLPGEWLAVAVEAPTVEDGELFAREEVWRFAVHGGGKDVVVGECANSIELIAALGDRPVIAHEAKGLGEVPRNLVFDTELAGYLLDPARRGYPLAELCEERGIAVECSNELAARAALTGALATEQRKELEAAGLEELLVKIELPLVRVLRETEKAGIKLDVKRLAHAAKQINADADRLEREIWELAGTEFTIGSPQQLAEILFNKLGLSKKRRGKTGFSTDARVLQAIRDEHPIVPKIERWRELTKLVQTYLEGLPDWIDPVDGRLHTTFVQSTAATGRLSSVNPNLQNIPVRSETGREVRACFVAEGDDVLISVDYSQVELRILAHIADEPVLKEIFRRGGDVHTETAAAVFGLPAEELTVMMRSQAKMVNYGIIYGLSAFGMADRLGSSQEEAEEFIERYLGRFPRVKKFMEDSVAQATTDGYVATMFGRRRPIPEISSPNWATRKLGERLAVNTIIQGTAADIMKIAMVRAYEALENAGLRTKIILQIHDELLFEGPEEEVSTADQLISDAMIHAYELDPPLAVEVGVGKNWLDIKGPRQKK